MTRPHSSPELPAPSLLGLPAKFTGWRPVQEQALLRHMYSDRRFVASDMPTGSGKSLMAIATAVMSGQRTCVLTSTKGLQGQYMDDFRSIGMVEVYGANHYACVALAAGEFGDPRSDQCDNGPCRVGVPCSKRKMGCLYYDAVERARQAQLVITNYAFWLYRQNNQLNMGDFDRLVLDEAHDAMDWLASYLSDEVFAHELMLIGRQLPRADADAKRIRQWARECLNAIQARRDLIGEQIAGEMTFGGTLLREQRKEIRKLDQLADKLTTVADSLDDTWVIERTQYSIKCSIVWPAPLAEQYLFRGTPHVDLVSATIRPKSAELLGIAPDALDFADYPSDFPASRRLVIHVPTVKMNHRNDADDERTWLARVDQLIGDRLDRKGIIHTVSYKRRDLVMAHSKYRDILLSHSPQTTRSTVEKFKQAPAPCVLVSPAVTTGWDFPFDAAEYQIILKVPFPDLSAPVMQRRKKDDKDYGAFCAALTLVQMVGRGMRAAEDQCETLVTDDNLKWFLYEYRRFFPRWFLEACTSVKGLPKPPKVIGG